MLDKFLVVGVGGSGGRTVRYLRAEIRRRLLAVGMPDAIPDGWGFVHVDVPTETDVSDAGADPDLRYVGLASSGVSYRQVAGLVERKSAAARSHIAGWSPDPSQLRVEPSLGAGQKRAVGRMVAAAAMQSLVTGLRSELLRVESAGPGALSAVSDSIGDGPREGQRTWIIVVSSLAGGSGSGMFIDVCDVLRMLAGSAGYPVIGALYAPDIFADLRGAQRRDLMPNGLAALSELLAAYWDDGQPQANEHALLTVPDLLVPQDASRRGPSFPFILSRSNGTVTLPTQSDVYRLTAAGLSAWMFSGSIQDQFAEVTIGNWGLTGERKDNSGLTDNGVQPLSSFGYASVTVGRERFGLYSTQRFAGELVMHLLTAHRNGEQSSDSEALAATAAAHLDNFVDACGLQETEKADHDILDALRGGAEDTWKAKLTAEVNSIISSLTERKTQIDRDATIKALGSAVESRRLKFVTDEVARIELNARSWVLDVQAKILEMTPDYMARIGARATAELLALLYRYLKDEVAPQMRLDAKQWDEANRNPVRETIAGILGAASKKLKTSAPELTSATQQGVIRWRNPVESRMNTIAAGMVVDLADNFVQPLQRALLSEVDQLQLASEGTERDPSPVKRWASGLVPDELRPADYEVILEEPLEWPSSYDRILQRQTAIVYAEEARLQALRSVVTNYPLIAIARRWSPAVSVLNTESGPARAQFVIDLSLDTLLAASREWLYAPTSEIRSYIEEPLAEWLTSTGGPGDSDSDRQRKFLYGFSFALTKARPLIELDNAALSRVHDDAKIAEDFATFLTPLPIDSTHAVAAGLRRALRVAGLSDEEMDDAFAPNSKNSTFGVLTVLRGPVSPLVVNSIAEPLAAGAHAHLDDNNFWNARRTRPLPQAMPCPPSFLRALLRGWFCGRLTGTIDIVDPRKPRVLGSSWIELASFIGSEPSSAEHVLGSVCESMPLAIVDSVRANEGALDFFVALAALGSPIHQIPDDLAVWVKDAAFPEDSRNAVVAELTGHERTEALASLLDELREDYQKIASDSTATTDEHVRRQRDLAPELVEVLAELRSQLGALSSSTRSPKI